MQRRKKLEEKKIKTREQNKGRKSKRCCRRQFTWLIIALLSNRYRSGIAPVLLGCRPDIATLSLCCRSAVTTLSHRYCSAVATPLLLCCRAPVTPLSHRYPYTVAPLLSLLLSLRSYTAIAPPSRRCQTARRQCNRGVTA